MPQYPLMPKAIAVWLVDNTVLTFKQIAEFCGLHELEVKGIADGDVAAGIMGVNPISTNQLSQEELDKGISDPNYNLQILESKIKIPKSKTKRKATRYTPLSKRQDRPAAIAWLIHNHGELNDSQISKLVGTTKPTIQAIRNRTHWSTSQITPNDPVTLGLCKQLELDEAIQKAQAKKQRELEKNRKKADAKAKITENLKPIEDVLEEN